MEVTSIVIAIAAAVFGLLAAAFTALFQKREKAKQQELREVFTEKYMNILDVNYDKLLEQYLSLSEMTPKERAMVDDYKRSRLSDWRNILFHYPLPQAKKDVEAEVNSKIEEMNKRIETIEARLPKDDTLDKLASINDAILATQMEALAESVKRLQEKALTKWDVAKVVFTILGALGVTIGIVLGIMNLVQQ